ncbi:phage tail tube protein [Chromobacterium sp. S0633]|uniref:phage tail tube protein n=1 Tax=Chromobacterium sp. S0633 TaxID=2957805 RepID=UPI0020A1E655|nr:phage tail tube protein [Chromobacterium sp. S0633]MCP1290934.1 phage tail tube protein [Chromobacterium sp. S0633]
MADTTNLLAGTATLTVDGTAYMLEGDLSYSVSKVSRETMKGMDGVHGYKETPNAPFIAGTFRDSSGLTVADFNKMTNVTVTAKLANGKTIIGRNMWTVETQEVETAEGTVKVRWEGMSVEEA